MKESKTELEEYANKLSLLDDNRSRETVLNNSKEHASALFFRIIDGAQQNVNIISQKLELYNANNIVQSLEDALKRGVRFKLLLDGKVDSENNFFKTCKNSKLVKIKKSSKKISSHIITRDDRAYRYCSDTTNHHAIASFNDIDVVENAYDKVFQNEVFSSYPDYK